MLEFVLISRSRFAVNEYYRVVSFIPGLLNITTSIIIASINVTGRNI